MLNPFKNKETLSLNKLKIKKSWYIFLFGGLLISFIMISFVYKVDNNRITNLIHRQTRKEICLYLKSVQPLEDEFYQLVNENVNFLNNRSHKDEIYLAFLIKNMDTMDEIMLSFSTIETNQYMIENKRLFVDEIMTMRDLMIEEKRALENKDLKSFELGKEYLEAYMGLDQKRREDLKEVFDKYNIVYIDLGNRIKYKVK